MNELEPCLKAGKAETLFDGTTNPFSEGQMRNTVIVFDRTTNPFSEVSEGKMRNIVTALDRRTNLFSEVSEGKLEEYGDCVR